MPVVIIARNYFHGTLMVKRRTGGMAVGGVIRVLAIAVLAQGAFAAGWLDHVVAAFILLLGFVAETVVVLVGHTRLTRETFDVRCARSWRTSHTRVRGVRTPLLG